MTKMIVKFGLILIIIIVSLIAVLAVFQDKLLFHPRKTLANHQYDFPVPFTERVYQTPNGGNIHTILFQQEESKGLVFYLHGNAGNLEDWAWLYQDFLNRKQDVIFIDYRTYGKSTGKLSENNIYTDNEFIFQEMLKIGYSPEEITIFGRSIGTGPAVHLAATHPVKALILETPYYNLQDLVKRVMPIPGMQHLLRFQFDSAAKMGKIECPIAMVHGTEDQVIPLASAKKLHQEFKQKTSLLIIEGGMHNDLSRFEEYQVFLDECLDE